MSDFNTIIPRGVPTLPAKVRKTDESKKRETPGRDAYSQPGRSRINIIPTAARLQELIEQALEALSRGIYWERGSIINLLL